MKETLSHFKSRQRERGKMSPVSLFLKVGSFPKGHLMDKNTQKNIKISRCFNLSAATHSSISTTVVWYCCIQLAPISQARPFAS